jgi:2-polyprenyl-3-methyl-5-hydroxy-6-metoxy-1,4-benzoquinol methylase/predicted  nucleic acid-binding Zn-ribbon protein
MAEFTGERVIPGKVDVDLWNEHISRYHFAARLARHKRVLDIGCGTGYGTAELAHSASHATGVDCSQEAISHAQQNYQNTNLQFQVAQAEHLPFDDASYHLVVCFEVIEHLADYRALLSEVRRVLSPHGQFLVSTPNIKYYAESRKLQGPNPYHAHEFDYQEYRALLSEYFEHQTFFLQNHTTGIVFLPTDQQAGAELRLDTQQADPEDAHFFLAVCAAKPMTGSPAYFYVPAVANVLREREVHIAQLEAELKTKNSWLDQSRAEHAELVTKFRNLQHEIEAKNRWAQERDQEVKRAAAELERLEAEHNKQQTQSAATIGAYEERLRTLEQESAALAEWFQKRETDLNTEAASLSKHIQHLDAEIERAREAIGTCQRENARLEATVVERTEWAQREQQSRELAEALLQGLQASRWTKLGRAFGLGPKS